VLARSWDGSNNWTHLTGVSCNMTNVAWTQSDTVVALSAQQLAYPYLMVYAGTNFNTNNAAITNAYLRVYSRSE